MRLHQLNQAHYPPELTSDILLAIQPLDAVLLIEAAVLRLNKHNDPLLEKLQAIGAPVHILLDDKQAYGITVNCLVSSKITPITNND